MFGTGGDPLGAKRALREALTVGDVLDAYLASEEFADKAEITKPIDRGRIERHLRPLLGKKHAHLVTEDDVQRAFAAIRDGKTATDVKTGSAGRARVRGGEGAARMAIIVLGRDLQLGDPRPLDEREPCRFIKMGTQSAPARQSLTALQTMPACFRHSTAWRGEAPHPPASSGCDPSYCLDRMPKGRGGGLAMVSCRSEAWASGASATRAQDGRKTGKPRIIGLPAAAQAIIARQPDGPPDGYVFAPARGDGGAIDLSHVWAGRARRSETTQASACMGCAIPWRATWRWQGPRLRKS